MTEGVLSVEGTEVFRAVTVHEHSWSEEWSSSEACHWHECETPLCGVTDNADKDGYGKHSPTTVNGKRVCLICGAELADIGSTDQSVPKTGDSARPLLWAMLLLTSFGAAAAMLIVAGKKRADKKN